MAYRVSSSSMHVVCSLKYNLDLVMFFEMEYWRLMAACIAVAVMACKRAWGPSGGTLLGHHAVAMRQQPLSTLDTHECALGERDKGRPESSSSQVKGQ